MVQTIGHSRTWRPFGYWALTLNVSLIPPFIVLGPTILSTVDMVHVDMLSDLYPGLLAAWVSAAAVRQWGKIKGAET